MSRGSSAINKTYLVNTISSIESHNRREEASDCWRQYDMAEKVRRELSSPLSGSKRRAPEEDQITNDEKLRAMWAEKKARSMVEAHLTVTEPLLNAAKDHLSVTSESSSDDYSSSSSEKKKKHKKKDSKKKRQKSKKEKKGKKSKRNK